MNTQIWQAFHAQLSYYSSRIIFEAIYLTPLAMLKFYLMEQTGYFIRPMKDEDIPQVSKIDREAFPAESLFRPYTSYSQEIHNSLAHYIVAYVRKKPTQENRQKISWLSRLFGHHREISPISKEQSNLHSQDHILGFAGLWVMLAEAHIIAIAVRNDYRRIGIGEGLLISIIELAAQLNAGMVTLEVRASNIVAQSLYDKYGFHVARKHPRYYSDNDEDAVLMSTDSITSASFQTHLQKLKHAHDQKQEIG